MTTATDSNNDIVKEKAEVLDILLDLFSFKLTTSKDLELKYISSLYDLRYISNDYIYNKLRKFIEED